MKYFLFLFLTIINLHANFNEGRKIFDAKCSSCHEGYVDVDTLKKNFYEYNNTLLHLKAPSENMLIFAIMNGSKSIGVKDDDEMRHIEIEEYLKSHLEEPDTFQSICESSFFKYYATKSCEKTILSDEQAVHLTDFIMEYKPPKKKEIKKEKLQKEDISSILSQAKKESKNIIIYASSKTCHFCIDMDKNVLSKEEVQKILNKYFIFLKVDINNQKLPYNLDKDYKGMTPTFFIINANKEKLNTYPGAWTKKDFIDILKENKK